MPCVIGLRRTKFLFKRYLMVEKKLFSTKLDTSELCDEVVFTFRVLRFSVSRSSSLMFLILGYLQYHVPALNSQIKMFKFNYIYSDDAGPCMLVVYKMAYYRTASISRCVPMNADFLRNTVQEIISEDVNQTEEYGIVSVVLIGLELGVGVIFAASYCLRKDSNGETDHHHGCRPAVRDPRDAFQATLE